MRNIIGDAIKLRYLDEIELNCMQFALCNVIACENFLTNLIF
jgi:hypothetical protein